MGKNTPGASQACPGMSLREDRMAVVLSTKHKETSYRKPSDLHGTPPFVCVLLPFRDLMEK